MKQRKPQTWESPAVQLPCWKTSSTSMDNTSEKRIEHENRTSPDTLAILGQMLVWSTTACRHTSI